MQLQCHVHLFHGSLHFVCWCCVCVCVLVSWSISLGILEGLLRNSFAEWRRWCVFVTYQGSEQHLVVGCAGYLFVGQLDTLLCSSL